MNLQNKTRCRKESKHGNRFYTSLDMSIIKHDIAVNNAKIKRKEKAAFNNQYIVVCGCGVEGCFIHSGFETIDKDKYNESLKNRRKHH